MLQTKMKKKHKKKNNLKITEQYFFFKVIETTITNVINWKLENKKTINVGSFTTNYSPLSILINAH